MSPTFIILIVSMGLFLIWLGTCEMMLRRKFDKAYSLPIVEASNLEFPAIRKITEDSEARIKFPRLFRGLHSDFLILTYLLKNAAAVHHRFWRDEVLLILYFRLVSFSLVVRRPLRLRQKPAMLKLTTILEYLANVAGEQTSGSRVTNPAFLNLLEDLRLKSTRRFLLRIAQPRYLLLTTSLGESGFGPTNS